MALPDAKTLKKIWSEVPPDYYYRLNYLQTLWHDWKWIVIKYLVTKSGKKPKKVLEVGCSGGHLCGLLQEVFPTAKITGIDVYEPAIREAKARYPKLTFSVADAHKLPFADNSFDLVISSETIEHVLDPAKMLKEIERVMKPTGEALVEMDSGSLPFRFIWYFWTKFGKGKVWRHAHLHPFTSKELERLISGNGFAIAQKHFSHFGMAVSFLVTKHQSIL